MKQLKNSFANVIDKCYGVGKSTVLDIKKNSDKILRLQQEMRDIGMSKKAKVMKVGDQGRVLAVQAKSNGGHTYLRPDIV